MSFIIKIIISLVLFNVVPHSTDVHSCTLDTPEEVALAYNDAARSLCGPKAKTNFPLPPVAAATLCLDLNVPTWPSVPSSGRLVLSDFLQPGIVKEIDSPPLHQPSSVVVAHDDDPLVVVDSRSQKLESSPMVLFLGLIRCGLPINLNKPPPLWL